MPRQFTHTYNNIISLENLLLAWREFLNGKRNRKDVQEFERNLMLNVISLHNDFVDKTYKHSNYQAFDIADPKPRNIHKAEVKDRLLHHAIYRLLYPYFDSKFIHDSYSCRVNKGTHKAMQRFQAMTYKVSKNNTQTCFVLKCDIKKFFANINHEILKSILIKHIKDKEILWLLSQVIDSFTSHPIGKTYGVGLPLGNLTSQLLVNIYMNEFDQYMKRELKVRNYIRYADDFVVLSRNKDELNLILQYIVVFLKEKLKLELHPDKVYIKTFASGVDFLGWVHFSHHRVLRTSTKRRMLKNFTETIKESTKQSYLGMLKHGNAYKLRKC
ncbi:MAG: reverse transcriptase domain-containing protein [Candidatus Paceibacterota bacterium]